MYIVFSVARDGHLFSLLEKIVSEQREQRKLLTTIFSKLNQSSEDIHEGLKENFPITSQEKLKELEEKLEEKDFASSVVSLYNYKEIVELLSLSMHQQWLL